MVQSDPRLQLPTSAELPCSDDTPVDNEDQNFIPNYLLFLLEFIWAERNDWFFGIDMGIYHTTGISPQVPVVPDGFLSLGVARRKDGRSRYQSGKVQREVLSWFNQQHQRYLTPEEQLKQYRQRFGELCD